MNTFPWTFLAEGGTERSSQEVTQLAERVGWAVGLLLLVALVYWLMRQGWRWRGTLQSGLPEPAGVPEEAGTPRLVLDGRYHGTTTAGQWLDRVVAHGLGLRSRAELTLTDRGLTVLRPGTRDFFIPAGALRGARLDKGIAGKVVTEGGLLVISWQLGEQTLDSGFRSDHPAEHAAWLAALTELTPPGDSAVAVQHDREGA
ncbi:hypothetical protein JJV70_21370 [Streptomyces sp. JJ66]|uniref:PH-like domain-containing protein n=1 Tax=Streptomyces sp. JJ66 TaxID=2803843 RepID=UPI001C5631EB|nr:hypothetical protein [Streptomyces sp. JJ66]MBW1604602.1 hypothetical protein [Streptomyces sp. JJ66]